MKGTGRGGRVTLDDVKGFVKTERQRVHDGGGGVGGSVVDGFALPPLPDFAKYGAGRDGSRLADSARRSPRT